MIENALNWAALAALWSLVPALAAFAVLYARRSPWRSTPAGRAIMYLVVTILAVLLFGVARSILGDDFADLVPVLLVRLAVYAAVAASGWRMLAELVRQQRIDRAEMSDTDPDLPRVR